MTIKAALVIVVLSVTPAMAQEIHNVRDANGNLPRDKGISTNTNPTNVRASVANTQNMPAKPAVPPASKPAPR
jgi:hypothetical protein